MITWDDLQGKLEYLNETKTNYLEEMLEQDYCSVFNIVRVHYNLDDEIIAKAVYHIGNSDGAIEVLEWYIQNEYDTIEECIVWAKRFD